MILPHPSTLSPKNMLLRRTVHLKEELPQKEPSRNQNYRFRRISNPLGFLYGLQTLESSHVLTCKPQSTQHHNLRGSLHSLIHHLHIDLPQHDPEQDPKVKSQRLAKRQIKCGNRNLSRDFLLFPSLIT